MTLFQIALLLAAAFPVVVLLYVIGLFTHYLIKTRNEDNQ